MTILFSWQICQPLFCFILYSKAKLACYSRCLLTSYFFVPVPYDENDIFMWCQFQKVLQVFIELFSFCFFGISAWTQTCIIVILNGQTWKLTEVILLFLRLHPSTTFWTLLLTLKATQFLLRDSCPQQQIQWSTELNLSIPFHLIP